MPEALIKGETHFSRKDKRALMELDLSQFDAVFREGSDRNYFERDLDWLYTLFAIGHLVYGATFGRLYFSKEDFKEKSENKEVPFYDEIDAAIYETYELVPRWKRAGLFLISPFWAGIILGMISIPFRLAFSWVPQGWTPLLVYSGAIGGILFFGFIWALAFFQLIESEVMYDRDDEMVEEILRIVEENGCESILVSCGDNHRSGIASCLREEGWDVEEETTDSYIGKIQLYADKLLESVLHPWKTLSKLGSMLFR